MEAYVNFGFIGGVISFLFLGGFYRFLYERFLARPNFVRTVLLLASISALMIWMRNTSLVYTRTFVWAMIAPWAVQLLFPSEEPVDFEYIELEGDRAHDTSV
jgi:hypothetical protein